MQSRWKAVLFFCACSGASVGPDADTWGQQPAPIQRGTISGARGAVPGADRLTDRNSGVLPKGLEPAPRSAPQLLILKDGQVLQGRIRAEQGGYHVDTRNAGRYIPSQYVMFTADSLQDAYRQVSSLTLDQPPGRDMRLGRWCFENGLYDEAAAHFKNVLAADATNAEAKDRLARLKTYLAFAEHRDLRAQASPNGRSTESLCGLSQAAVEEFVTRVQPLLVSRCGSAKCHGQATAASSFRLERVRLGTAAGRAVTARNLEAVLKQLDPKIPAQSALLRNGLRPHGGLVRSPLDSKTGVDQQSRLRQWAKNAAVEMSNRDRDAAARDLASRIVRSANPRAVRDRNVVPASGERWQPGADGTPDKNRKAGGSLVDPFDPEAFNARQEHQRSTARP